MEESVKPDYTSISSIIEQAKTGQLLLPEFQRPFVWSIEQSKDLFDSLLRGIFIGTFVMSKPQFDLTCRKIDTRPRSGKGSRAKFDDYLYKANQFDGSKIEVVLDGQQRITSLYRVLNGFDKVFFIFKKPDSIPLPTNTINDFEDIIESLSIKPVEDYFSIELSQVYECATWKDREIQKKIFDPLADSFEFLADELLRERYFDLLLDLKRLLYNKIQDKTLLSVFFLNMGIEKFCMFFERSNSKGTELSFIDIITAKIYKDFKLDNEIKKFKEKNKSIPFDNTIIESFVRYFSFLKAGQVDRKTILTSLNGGDFNDNWSETCELYKKSYVFLESQKLIVKNDWIPYKTMYIPIIHFLKNLPHQDFTQMSHNQSEYFRFWFWGSLLNTRYGGGMNGSTNDIIVEDLKNLEKISKGASFTKDYLKQFKFDFKFENLLEVTSKGAIFMGIISIMNHSKPFRNLGNSNLISFNNDINIHHIFPTKYLEKNFDLESFENENSNSILNKMIIEKIPNIKFGEKKPSSYLNELFNKNISYSLESHLINNPEKLIDGTQDFKQFVENRAELIIQVIKNEVADFKEKFINEFEII
jgi:hypothetical protein